MQGAGGMGNTDRQQSDSRVSAEGKKTVCKKQAGLAGPETGRQTGREREGTVREMGKQGPLSTAPPGFWPAASSSINSTQGNGEEGKERMGRGVHGRAQSREMAKSGGT